MSKTYNEEIQIVRQPGTFWIITPDIPNKMCRVWYIGHSDMDFFKFMQYLIDSVDDEKIEEFMVYNPINALTYSAIGIARNILEMRKQTFEEKHSGKEPYWMKAYREYEERHGKEPEKYV